MGQDDYDFDAKSFQTHQTTKTIVTTKTEMNIKIEITDKTDFVIVDLRDEAAFEKYHVVDGNPG